MRKDRVMEQFYKFGVGFVKIAGMGLAGLLSVSGFLFTCYAQDMTSQAVLRKWDNVLINILGMAVWGGLLWLAGWWGARKPETRKRILLLAVLAWCAVTGLVLVVFGKTVPAADSMSVYSIGEELAAGNLGVIHPVDSYLSYYPQQVGLAAYYEGIIRLWNLLPWDVPAYHIIKCINVGWACVLIFFLYKSVQLLFKDDRAECIFLVMAGANLPLIFYTSFVYGEIPSFACFTIGLWGLLRFLGGGPVIASPGRLAALAGLTAAALALSVMLRKNSLILVIAAVLVLLFQWLKTGRHTLFLTALLCLVCSLAVLPLIQKGYEARSHNTLSSGVTAISYVAMGMQESSRGNGWYNAFNFDTYQESGMDKAAASALSRQAIGERLSYFKDHPGYAARFYMDKFLSQWADGTYACRQATLATFGGRSPFFQQVYEGRYSPVFIFLCNAYQNILYAGTALFCLIALKKKTRPLFRNLPIYLCLIGVFGGFLFHMVWEANSRYIFPYGLLLMPYAAYGISRLGKPAG